VLRPQWLTFVADLTSGKPSKNRNLLSKVRKADQAATKADLHRIMNARPCGSPDPPPVVSTIAGKPRIRGRSPAWAARADLDRRATGVGALAAAARARRTPQGAKSRQIAAVPAIGRALCCACS
jgi:hypothetical protein